MNRSDRMKPIKRYADTRGAGCRRAAGEGADTGRGAGAAARRAAPLSRGIRRAAVPGRRHRGCRAASELSRLPGSPRRCDQAAGVCSTRPGSRWTAVRRNGARAVQRPRPWARSSTRCAAMSSANATAVNSRTMTSVRCARRDGRSSGTDRARHSAGAEGGMWLAVSRVWTQDRRLPPCLPPSPRHRPARARRVPPRLPLKERRVFLP